MLAWRMGERQVSSERWERCRLTTPDPFGTTIGVVEDIPDLPNPEDLGKRKPLSSWLTELAFPTRSLRSRDLHHMFDHMLKG